MTLLHQAAQKALRALTAVRADRRFNSLESNHAKALVAGSLGPLESALQQQPEPVALKDGVPNTEAAIAYALNRWGYRQGMKECIAFYRGACWLQLATPSAGQRPTDAQVRAFADALGMWVEPYEAARESGVEVECSISPEDAERHNAEFIATIREAWDRAFSSSPSLQHQEEPTCLECGDGIVAHDPGVCGTCYAIKYRDGHQEVPREPVAHMVALDDGLGTVFLKFLGERPPAGTMLYASPSTTRQQEVGSGWKPIESAPKDGTWIAAIGHLGKDTPDTLKWKDGEWWNGYDTYVYEPTHWMPLPAAPSTPENADGGPHG